MRYAQIIDGTVANVIVWDGETDLGLDGELVNVDNTQCGPGWTVVDGVFTAPPETELDGEGAI
jgi:hypothetical protein